MTWQPVEGYAPVKRFVRGHIYYIGTRTENKYLVGEFKRKGSTGYVFTKIVDNSTGNDSHVFHVQEHALPICYVREVHYEDMPLYMNAKYLSLYYKRLLAGQPMRIKRRLKQSRNSLKTKE